MKDQLCMLTTQVSNDFKKEVKAYAGLQGISISAFMRQAILAYMEEPDRQKLLQKSFRKFTEDKLRA